MLRNEKTHKYQGFSYLTGLYRIALDWSVGGPTRLGVRIPPTLQSFVLIGPEAKIHRPRRFDTSRVVKADQLKKAIWRDIDSENVLIGLLRTAAKIVSGETVEFVARQLVAQHRPKAASAVAATGSTAPPARKSHAPSKSARPARIEPTFDQAQSKPVKSAVAGPACKDCSGTAGSILYGKFGYYFQCDGCGKNTAIRFTCHPGHQARLRKDGDRFYRECAECGSSEIFHRNPPTRATR